MVIEQAHVELAATIIRNIAWIFLYFFIGFGPGFIVGILIANRVWGRGRPSLMDVHRHHAAEATDYNKQFDPKHPRWSR